MAQRSLEYEAPSNEPTAKPQHNHLLAIGIDEYQSEGIHNLRNARDDAQALAKLLKESYHFQGTCKELYNEQATRANIYRALDEFVDHSQEEDNLLIYFSGHGYYRQRTRRGYWVPHDARLGAYDSLISNTALLQDYLPHMAARHVVLIVDCCFSGTLFRSLDFEHNPLRAHNLQQMMQGRSRLGIAAGSIELVSDGLVGNHSPFTRALLELLKNNQEPFLPVRNIFHPLSEMTTYQAEQRPVYGVLAKSAHDLGHQFVFQRVVEHKEPAWETLEGKLAACRTYLKAFPSGQHHEDALWEVARLSQQRNDYQAYLRAYRRGKHALNALNALEDLEAQRAFDRAMKRGALALHRFLLQYPDSPLAEQAEAELERLEQQELQAAEEPPQQKGPTIIPAKTFDFPIPELVLVKGGQFMMGSEEEEDEQPVHEVALDNFYLGKYPVTVEEFRAFMERSTYRTDAEKKGGSYAWTGSKLVKKEGVDWRCDANGNRRSRSEDQHPVIHVSWEDAVAYCEWLSKETGQTWRLPTEAEWEYAARGGQESKGFPYAGSNDLDKVAWYYKNSGGKTHAVGQQQPNELGLYDLSGNVWEWCGDWYAKDYYQTCKNQGLVNNPPGPDSGSARVLRGGSWCYYPSYCRSAFRYYVNPDLRYSFNGFRCART